MRHLFLPVCFLLLIQVPPLVAQKVDLRNYVIGGYDANLNEIRLAQGRVRAYWQKNGARFGDKARYLAGQIISDETRSQLSVSGFSQAGMESASLSGTQLYMAPERFLGEAGVDY